MLGASGFSLAFWCQVTPTFDALSAVLSQACKCNMCQQLHGTHTCIYFYLSLGHAQRKTSRAPAVMQRVNLAALLIEELGLFLFLTHSNAPFWHMCQQVWSGVKRHAAQKWRSCHIRWTSRSRDSTACGIAQAAHTWPVGTRAHGLTS